VSDVNDGKVRSTAAARATGAADAEFSRPRCTAHASSGIRQRQCLHNQRECTTGVAKAMRQRSRKGLHAAHHHWIEREWDALSTLHAAGASVPKPYLRCATGILMEYLGHDDARAPSLAEVKLSPAEAQAAWPLVLQDLEILLANGLVHGDLSATTL
jgi:serine/threonine-protein kinase RIO1